MAFLKVYSNGEERTVFLGDEPIIVGRGQDTDLMLRDGKASRRHAVIEPRGSGRWRVLDMGSGNGTKVNGKRIEKRDLRPDRAHLAEQPVGLSGSAHAHESIGLSRGAWKPDLAVHQRLGQGSLLLFRDESLDGRIVDGHAPKNSWLPELGA